ncbi:MAG: peptidylprolyl isomerase [Muribaculaceae bacterium]|nr:peptidylprolyl isomerase [Muribaculaceae bacterium]
MKTLTLSILLSIFASIAISAQNNIAEEVAWVVGDQLIYKSEIEAMYQQMQYERTPINGDPYCVIPEKIAVEKLFLHQADIDTVEVQNSMIQQQVDSRINYYISNLGSKEKVEQYFRKTIPQMREEMTEMWKNQSRVQQVQASLTKNLKTTPSDVRKYFSNLHADSIPFVPMQVEVQIITLNPIIPLQEIEDVKARLRDYSNRITNGESEFSTLAILYSEDGSSVRGGEIGFMGRGHLEPEYAAVAFNLNDPKKVSKIVETQYGYHIIQLIEKRGDRINTRHILLRPKVSDKDLTAAIERLDSVRADILDKKFTFEDAAPVISQDKDTRNSKGVMVNSESGTIRFEMSQLPQEIAHQVNKLNPGEISMPFIMKDPKLNRDIVAIVKLTNRIEGHKANLSDDYQLIKSMYEASAKANIISEWINKKIDDTYIRIEDGWNNCQFEHNWLKK